MLSHFVVRPWLTVIEHFDIQVLCILAISFNDCIANVDVKERDH
jgi:hypothetical protein